MVFPETGLWFFGRTDFKSAWQGVHEVAFSLGAIFFVWAIRGKAIARQRIIVATGRNFFIGTSLRD
jgi:hypothetical protein